MLNKRTFQSESNKLAATGRQFIDDYIAKNNAEKELSESQNFFNNYNPGLGRRALRHRLNSLKFEAKKNMTKKLFLENFYDLYDQSLLLDEDFKFSHTKSLYNLCETTINNLIEQGYTSWDKIKNDSSKFLQEMYALCEDAADKSASMNVNTDSVKKSKVGDDAIINEKKEQEKAEEVDVVEEEKVKKKTKDGKKKASEVVKDKVTETLKKEKEASEKEEENKEEIKEKSKTKKEKEKESEESTEEEDTDTEGEEDSDEESSDENSSEEETDEGEEDNDEENEDDKKSSKKKKDDDESDDGEENPAGAESEADKAMASMGGADDSEDDSSDDSDSEDDKSSSKKKDDSKKEDETKSESAFLLRKRSRNISRPNKLKNNSLFRSIEINVANKYLKEIKENEMLNESGDIDMNMDLIFAESLAYYTLLETMNTVGMINLSSRELRSICNEFILKK